MKGLAVVFSFLYSWRLYSALRMFFLTISLSFSMLNLSSFNLNKTVIYFWRKKDLMCWYSIFLLLERMLRTGRGDRFGILLSSSRMPGIYFSFLSSGFTKYFRAWIHRFTSSLPCSLQRSMISSSLFLEMKKFRRSSLIPNFLQRLMIPSSKSYILKKDNNTLLSGFLVVLFIWSNIFSA